MPRSHRRELTDLYDALRTEADLATAAEKLAAMGAVLGLDHTAVEDDFSRPRLLRLEDGRTLAELFGWETAMREDWEALRLHRISPVAAVCRLSTRPFVWNAADMAAIAEEVGGRRGRLWNVTPERGVVAGVTVPVHRPRCVCAAVSWTTQDADLDLHAVLAAHGTLLRLSAYRFMDLVEAGDPDGDPADAGTQLSAREVECLTWVALGHTDGDIAERLHRSATTVRFHVDNAVRKLGARNRAQAVAIACQLGLVRATRAEE